jgi:cytochrome c-type biogenesis protein CcmH
MTLWFVFALMTAAAIFAVLWPLSRRGADSGGSDIAVYRDQLDEITRDRSAGLIGEAEAEAAKVEVSRRLLAAADAAEAEKTVSADPPIWRRRSTAIAGLVLLPAGAIALYLTLGSPDMPGEPLATRQSDVNENSSVEVLVARVQDHIARNPNDGRAWEVLAPVYMRLGRFDDSVTAWRNVIRLNGSSASREADLGEALVFAANGIVTPEAKNQFDRAYALDPEDVMARFYRGIAADQAGRRAEAEAIWRDLLEKAPPGAPWVAMVRRTMERPAAPAASAPPSAPGLDLPGPSAADIAAAQKLAPDKQDQMINGMVSRLAERLNVDGSDVAGWLRLVRSYRVMNQSGKAEAAIADARRALAGDPDRLRQFAEGVEAAAPERNLPIPSLPAPNLRGPNLPGPNLPGPSAADIAAAQKLAPDQQNQMISSMVVRLADRLKQDGSDIEGWLRLLRAYKVLGEHDKAQATAADARRALGSDPEKIRRIDELVKELGL